jgi:hypothetical protein
MSGYAQSVRQRLKTLALSADLDFQRVLFRFAVERFLFRLANSPYRDHFVLKGATLFAVWGDGTTHRATRDVDLLGFGDASVETITAAMRAIAMIDGADGMAFDPASVQVVVTGEDRRYAGVRCQLVGYLAGAKITVKVDVGFGDAVHPPATDGALPTLLDMPAPVLRLYPKEAVVAEKFHAMVHVGTATSRFKDFYDIWLLARDFAFEGQILCEALAATFVRRQTAVPSDPPSTLQPGFWTQASSLSLWDGFLKKAEIGAGAPAFAEVAGGVAAFVLPAAKAAAADEAFPLGWAPGGPWSRL